jgi:hypothetical protein
MDDFNIFIDGKNDADVPLAYADGALPHALHYFHIN